jgi:hypothetical protein
MNKWIKITLICIIAMAIAKLFENYFMVVFVLGSMYGGISTYEIEDKSLFKFK